MYTSLDVFSQRRLSRVPDPASLSSKDVPADLSLTRLQQSFKISAERLHFHRNLFRRAFKYAVLGVLVIGALLSGLIFFSEIVFFKANVLGRHCLRANGVQKQGDSHTNPKFALVTCTDGGGRIPGRSFDGLLSLVAPNKEKYAKRHGYTFIDASNTLDASRPPSWSKILAVRKHLPNFDWVFWNDVDSLVTNPDISLEEIIGSVIGSRYHKVTPDLIITKDVTGINAGMFFFRNTEWSMLFLEKWWNQTSFVRPFGQMKSGDNDALKFLLQSMPEEEFWRHVAIPQMQCAFNSYLWTPALKNILRFMSLPQVVWQGAYSTGDFMVHLAGLNNKKAWVEKFLTELEGKDGVIQGSIRREGPVMQSDS
ncbi:hypothetical protein KP509_11G039700 [Ceratopteris richardii]|uniref:Uncharacterized protein n=1 Tax=Ceratopteris richardii TaxID=49495 RepID=A0A8T2TUI9_CERRI|nr:hypothetical protein KP509_11G039700 [Ceratopteris richardii]